MTTMEVALVQAGLTQPLPVGQRIWEHVKGHPACTIRMIASALALDMAVVRGHAAILVQKQLLSSKRVQRWDGGKLRDVHEFSVALSEYRDQPVQRRPRSPNKKVLERLRLEQAQAQAQAQATNAAIKIKQLTLQEAYALYQQLKCYFDAAHLPAQADD